jgi:hypothetical protein
MPSFSIRREAAVFERADAIFVFADGELELEDVVGLAEEYLARAIFGRLQPVDDDVEPAALEGRDDGLPVGRDELGPPPHRRGERLDHLLLVADVPVGVRRVRVDVGRAAARVSAPAQRLLLRRGAGGGEEREGEQ